MSTVDTSSFKFTLYAGMSTAAAAEVQQQQMIKPEFFMTPSNTRAWIPMSSSAAEALERARWGAEERGEMNLRPKHDFRIVQIDFTAHGFGYFYGTSVLTTRDWQTYRFHGDIATLVRSNNDDILVSLTAFFEVL